MMARRVASVIEWLSSGGLYIAAVFAVLVGGIITVSVIGREFFHHGFSWAIEVPEYMMAVIIFLGAGGAFRAGALLRVSLVIDRLKQPVADRLRVPVLVLGLFGLWF